MSKTFTKFALKAVLIYVLVVVLYFLFWHAVVLGVIPPSFNAPHLQQNNQTAHGTEQKVAVITGVDVKIYRYGFIPVYWSHVGNLMPCHQAFICILSVTLLAALAIKHRQLTFSPLKKSKMQKNEKKNRSTQLILTAWAFIGFLWFAFCQLLTVLPCNVSLFFVELLNYVMWITFFVSIVVLALPYFQILYYKFWSGGERNG